jgi:hypothetical protein
MEKISPVSPTPTNYTNNQHEEYKKQNNSEHLQPTQNITKDGDYFEKSDYSPYVLYNDKAQLYNNCIAQRIAKLFQQ